jgi:hypothetical protein
MFNKIYQEEINIYGQLDTVYNFYYDLTAEELLEVKDRGKSDIMGEYLERTKEISFYLTITKEPIVERVEFLSAPLDYFLDDNVYLPENIKEALMEIKKYIEGEQK